MSKNKLLEKWHNTPAPLKFLNIGLGFAVVLLITIIVFIVNARTDSKNPINENNYQTMSIFSKAYNQPSESAETPKIEFYTTRSNDKTIDLINLLNSSNKTHAEIIYQVIDLNSKKAKQLKEQMNTRANIIRVSLDNQILYEKAHPTEDDIYIAINIAIDALDAKHT